MAKQGVAPAGRLFNLILALVASPNGLTRDDLLSTISGYHQDYKPGVQNVALERKFERDKADLRELGIPLETIDSPGEPGNTQLTRYRIQKSVLEVPDGLTFTPEELSVMQAAALMWREGSLAQDARRAIMKLQSRAPSIDTSLIGVAPQLRISEPAVPALREAMANGHVVTFGYRKPKQNDTRERTVSPLALHMADGRWHLIAFDHDRDDHRVFLLSRIVGRVKETQAEIAPEHLHGQHDVIAELEALKHRQVARITVAPGSRAEARLRPRSLEPHGHDAEIRIETLDYAVLAQELLAYGADVSIIEPSELIDHFTDLTTTIARLHTPKGSEVSAP